MNLTTPEGSSFDYTDRFMMKVNQMINDSVPEKKVNITITSPGFGGSGSTNSGFVRMGLIHLQKEIELSQRSRQT